jgi:hypothetical protein
LVRLIRPLHLLLVGLLLLAGVVPASAQPPTPHRLASPEAGMSVFIFNEPTTSRRDLQKVYDVGFPWVKVLFRWSDIEHAHKGAYDWTEADRIVREVRSVGNGMQILARLDFQPWWARADGARNGPPDDVQDFADFVYAFVGRYSKGSSIGRVHAVQIWNEPNLTREWGEQPITRESAAEYVRLLSAAYRAAKEAGPTISVVSAGLAFTGVDDPACCQPDTRYLEWMYEAGLSGNYDALGVNANFLCPCVEAAPGSVPGFEHPSFYLRHAERLREIQVAHGDADRQVWLTEFGWSTSGLPGATPDEAERVKGELLTRGLLYAREHWDPWIGMMAVWTMANPSWRLGTDQPWDDEQNTWAVTNRDGSNRSSYDRLLQARVTRELTWQRRAHP